MKPKFDVTTGEFLIGSGGCLIDSDGDMILDLGGGIGLDMNDGDIHILSGSEFDPFKDEED